jgi:hypothetical protein
MPVDGAAQIDVAEDLQLPSLAPACCIDLENIAGGMAPALFTRMSVSGIRQPAPAAPGHARSMALRRPDRRPACESRSTAAQPFWLRAAITTLQLSSINPATASRSPRAAGHQHAAAFETRSIGSLLRAQVFNRPQAASFGLDIRLVMRDRTRRIACGYRRQIIQADANRIESEICKLRLDVGACIAA